MKTRIKRIAGILTSAVLLLSVAGIMFQPVAAQDTPKFKPLPEPKEGTFDADNVAKIDLKTLPVLPAIPDSIKAIWAEGQKVGNNPSVFSKIGDCMTASPDYLTALSTGKLELGKYSSVQIVIDRYRGAPARTPEAGLDSFNNPGLAAASGFNAASVLDPTWSDPQWCSAEFSPLTCEQEISKPSIAFIMFGTNDLNSLTPDQFDYYLRSVVVQVYNGGTIPVLTTFPNQPNREDVSVKYNQIVASIAKDYDLPLVNLWLAFDTIPNQGIDPSAPTHMTKPQSGNTASFTEEDLKAGYNLHNLLTLQALEAILKVVNKS
jgi:hypothetical protein